MRRPSMAVGRPAQYQIYFLAQCHTTKFFVGSDQDKRRKKERTECQEISSSCLPTILWESFPPAFSSILIEWTSFCKTVVERTIICVNLANKHKFSISFLSLGQKVRLFNLSNGKCNDRNWCHRAHQTTIAARSQ